MKIILNDKIVGIHKICEVSEDAYEKLCEMFPNNTTRSLSHSLFVEYGKDFVDEDVERLIQEEYEVRKNVPVEIEREREKHGLL